MSFMNTNTIAIVVAILGVGLGLWRAIATIRQGVATLCQEVRADIGGLRKAPIARARHSLHTYSTIVAGIGLRAKECASGSVLV